MTFSRTTLLAAVMALSVAGCANGGTDQAGGAPPSAAAPSPAASSEAPPAPAPSPGVRRTITGTVTAGVEANCLLLDENLLIFEKESLRAAAKEGATVTVTGHSSPGTMTTCMQGTPFLVTAIRAN
ncbi:hypothetical protein Asp14428_30680 [Actinoplanes sp. NBRC 14428]|uniref:Uncharacterized protein n=1 Tax=Pseudosporangium ferrugineum TaxID=439699 RepID=A0A2T0RS91_9ACTN|nr:hypothetical protein [Pseudosporangium ferrugineum]PRY24069.1 hypothetical protein CLV70_114202 [Pseudosporangium ferrugineum]BCJ51593.1 hypothetical protein Asp14428_30680 [Actinoplanes sp. NBRC 14428]